MTFIIINGEIDLSVASVMGLASCLLAFLHEQGVPLPAAILVTLAVGVIILIFIWFAFRKVPHSVRYGVSAIVAMLHDILVTMGVMSILGIFFGWEINALFLTAMLTVVAYSVQDTIAFLSFISVNICIQTALLWIH